MTWHWLIPVVIAAVLGWRFWNTRLRDDERDLYGPQSDGEGIGRDDGEGRS